MVRRRVTSDLRRANSSQDNGDGVTTRIPRMPTTYCWQPSIVVPLSIPPLDGDDGSDGGARWGVLSRYIRHSEGPDGTSTERLTRQWTTPLHSRGRTIPMLTAFHAKCRGSYRRRRYCLQSVSQLDSQTRLTNMYSRHMETQIYPLPPRACPRAYIYPLDSLPTTRRTKRRARKTIFGLRHRAG
jgi:hypothetical protein